MTLAVCLVACMKKRIAKNKNNIDIENEVIRAMLVTRDGQVAGAGGDKNADATRNAGTGDDKDGSPS